MTTLRNRPRVKEKTTTEHGWPRRQNSLPGRRAPLARDVLFGRLFNANRGSNFGVVQHSTCSVIGHKIVHGFDDSGALFDGDGKLYNWWTDSDRTAFKARTTKLIEQYDEYEILPGDALHRAPDKRVVIW